MGLRESLFWMFISPLLLLGVERFYAEKGRPWITPNLLTDALVGLLRFLAITFLFSEFIFGSQAFVRAHLSFLNTGLLDDVPAWVQVLVMFVALDFAYYAFHRLMHSTKVLWVFHAVHHSQRRPNPLLQNRAHVFEELIYILSMAVPPTILGGNAPAVYGFVIVDRFWNYFVHSDIKMNLGPLKYLFVTPQYHRIHHSLERRHFDKNFAGRLIVWDYLFGTIHTRFDEYPEIGIDGYPVVEKSTSLINVAGYAIRNFLYPFQALWTHFTRHVETHSPIGDSNSATIRQESLAAVAHPISANPSPIDHQILIDIM
jgi:sterol desaturase/sphingolipid hydroxylase (fatty acid hydroxylase superfamily)